MSRLHIREWHRTVLLLILLGIGIGMIMWSNANVDNNFVDQIQAPASSNTEAESN